MSLAAERTTPLPPRARSATAIAGAGLLAFAVPLFGFLVSLLLPLFAARARARLWPRTSPIIGHLCAALVVAGLWIPALLAVVSSGRLGSEATTWLILPLCAPVGAAALVVPSVLAIVAYLGGVTVGVIVRSPWPWVLGAWAAPLVYSAAASWLVDFACVA